MPLCWGAVHNSPSLAPAAVYPAVARATDDSYVNVTDESLAMWVVIVLHVLEWEHLYSNAQLLMLSIQCTINVRTHWKLFAPCLLILGVRPIKIARPV